MHHARHGQRTPGPGKRHRQSPYTSISYQQHTRLDHYRPKDLLRTTTTTRSCKVPASIDDNELLYTPMAEPASEVLLASILLFNMTKLTLRPRGAVLKIEVGYD